MYFYCTHCVTEGKRLAAKRHCHHVEVSALLDHKVDEVLVTILRDIRSQLTNHSDGGGSRDGVTSRGDNNNAGEGGAKGCLQKAAFGFFWKLFK